MIELDSVLIIIMIEALIALSILVLVFFIVIKKRQLKEHIAANELINKLEETEVNRTKKLSERVRESCQIDKEKLGEILKEINHSEHALYQQILQLFLKRDIALLKEIDQYVDKLSTPYCNVLRDAEVTIESSHNEELEQAREQISLLKREGAQLSDQLQAAMQMMDEISAEYARVFNGTQTELELENSSKKMLGIFAEAEKNIRSSFQKQDKE